jgi:hypothetical protein
MCFGFRERRAIKKRVPCRLAREDVQPYKRGSLAWLAILRSDGFARFALMPSISYRKWAKARTNELDEIAHAHALVSGTRHGRRYATQQVNRAYAVLLASQFQGFCRDLHSECVDHLVNSLAPSALQPIVRHEFTLNRQLDRANAQPGSIGADFGRLGIDFWSRVDAQHPGNAARKIQLDELNDWRNAIVHQDFNRAKLGGTVLLRLARVRRWRRACEQLAQAFDEVMRAHVQSIRGSRPW